MQHRQFKDSIYRELSRLGKAVSAPKRLELLELLCQSPRTVEALAEQCSISVANASQHLQILRAARLVESEKSGLYVTYHIVDEPVGRFFHSLRRLAETRLAEIEQITRQYVEERGVMEAITSDELIRRVRSGDVIVLDVRPPEEYRAGHSPGALSIPLAELKKRYRDLPKRREIVAYCRGPYCVMAVEAVDLLRKKGFRAHRMEEGVLDWKARGLRIETSLGEART